MLAERDRRILAALEEGITPIVSDTNLSPYHLQHIRELVAGKATVELKDFFDVPVDECIRRDSLRPNPVGASVIRRMAKQLEALKRLPVPPPPYDPNKEDVILCDLDGTLALFGAENPYSRNFAADTLNEPVARCLRSLGYPVIIVSGRSELYRDVSTKWLTDRGIWPDGIYMRPIGDTRKDAVLKEEIYRKYIEPRYNVYLVFDDRSVCINLWRSLGLVCFQVAAGDF